MDKIYLSPVALAIVFCWSLQAGSGFSTMSGTAASSKSKIKPVVAVAETSTAASGKFSKNLVAKEDTYVSPLPAENVQLPGVLSVEVVRMKSTNLHSVSTIMTCDGRTLSILGLQSYLNQFPLFRAEILQQGPCKHDWMSLSVLFVCMRILSDLEFDSKADYRYFLEANILLILREAFYYNPQINPNEIWPRCKELLNVCGIDSNKNSCDVMLNLEHSIFGCLKFLLSQNK